MIMDFVVADSWTKALRSGEYRQSSRGELRTVTGGVVTYDAVGVLCELAVKAGYCRWMNGKIDNDTSYYPSRGVMEWAGMDTDEGWNFIDSVIGLEDAFGGNFNVIASFVESKVGLV
jgi:hypothetical protein